MLYLRFFNLITWFRHYNVSRMVETYGLTLGLYDFTKSSGSTKKIGDIQVDLANPDENWYAWKSVDGLFSCFFDSIMQG